MKKKASFISAIVSSGILILFIAFEILVLKSKTGSNPNLAALGKAYIKTLHEFIPTLITAGDKGVAKFYEDLTSLANSTGIAIGSLIVYGFYVLFALITMVTTLVTGISATVKKNWIAGPSILILSIALVGMIFFQTIAGAFMKKPNDVIFIENHTGWIIGIILIAIITLAIIGIIFNAIISKKNKNIWETKEHDAQ